MSIGINLVITYLIILITITYRQIYRKKKWSIGLYNCFYGINILTPTKIPINKQPWQGIFNGKDIYYINLEKIYVLLQYTYQIINKKYI